MVETARVELPLKPSVETLQQQIDSMKEAVRLLQDYTNRMPTPAIVDGKVDALKELVDSEIAGLKELIKTILEGNKTALDATLRTNEKAGDELKSSIAKQFDSVSKRFDDLKERLDRGEGRSTGITVQKAEGRDDSRYLFLILGVIIAIAGIVAGFLR